MHNVVINFVEGDNDNDFNNSNINDDKALDKSNDGSIDDDINGCNRNNGKGKDGDDYNTSYLTYRDYVQRCFGPFSGVIGKTGNYERVEKEVRDLSFTLQEKIDRRRRDLTLGLPLNVR